MFSQICLQELLAWAVSILGAGTNNLKVFHRSSIPQTIIDNCDPKIRKHAAWIYKNDSFSEPAILPTENLRVLSWSE